MKAEVVRLYADSIDAKFEPRYELIERLSTAAIASGVSPTQQSIATLIDKKGGLRSTETQARTISTWGAGTRQIQDYNKLRICTVLDCTPEEAERLCRNPIQVDTTPVSNARPVSGAVSVLQQADKVDSANEASSANHPQSSQIEKKQNDVKAKPVQTGLFNKYASRSLGAIVLLVLLSLTVKFCTPGKQGVVDMDRAVNHESSDQSDVHRGELLDYCPIFFRNDQKTEFNCSEIGVFESSENIREGWNGISTVVHVPEGSTLHGLYQSWEGPSHGKLNKKKAGYFRFNTGYNRLDKDEYALYHDVELTNFFRNTTADEMNDKLQGLFIFEWSEGQVEVWSDNDPEPDKKLILRRR